MTKYTARDAGCYLDSARGIYMTDEIVDFARSHGAKIKRDCDCSHDQSCFDSEFASCEWIGDYEDEADAHMNDHYSVPGHYWGRNEYGDWG
ncbi:MAG: hypothetical protein ACREYE_04835, partial [Gammaproteobacteria bacterium]